MTEPEQGAGIKKHPIAPLIIQSAMVVLVLFIGWYMFRFMILGRIMATNSAAESASQTLTMYQQQFWAIMFNGGAVASSIMGLVLAWKQKTRLRYFNFVALALLVAAFLAINFLVYRQPYPPCPNCL
jgi:hypothetical protein